MSEPSRPSIFPDRDYEAIESAVMETERGRWFLAEYARRNRSADTDILLTAIKRLESALADHQPPEKPLADDRLRFDLMEMAATIAQTRLDVAAIAPKNGENGHIANVTSELGSIVTETENATYDILQGAEGIQEIAWEMRDSGTGPEFCSRIESQVAEVFSACEFQDLTGQRIEKVVNVLEYIEKRLNSMIDIWGDETLIAKSARVPEIGLANAVENGAITQGDIDELMWNDADSLPQSMSSIGLGKVDVGEDDPDPVTEPDHEDGPATPTRRDLLALSQDQRTALFS